MMETAVGYPCDVLLEAQFTVKVYTKVANNFAWLDDVTTNRHTEVGTGDIVKDRFGPRSFRVSAPTVWPDSLKSEDTSREQFKRLLKTVLFERAYLSEGACEKSDFNGRRINVQFDFDLIRLARLPNQAISVFTAFNCSFQQLLQLPECGAP